LAKAKLTLWTFVVSIVVVFELLNFTALAVAGSLEHIKAFVVDQMSLLIHVTNWPIAQLAVVDDGSTDLCAIAEGKRSARERFSFDALDFTFAD
jgi:hypothetical protein